MKEETIRAGLEQGLGILWEQSGVNEQGEPLYRMLPAEQINRNMLKLAAEKGASAKELHRLEQDLQDPTSTPLPDWWGDDDADAYMAAFVFAQRTVNHLSIKAIAKKFNIKRQEVHRLLRVAEAKEAKRKAQR